MYKISSQSALAQMLNLNIFKPVNHSKLTWNLYFLMVPYNLPKEGGWRVGVVLWRNLSCIMNYVPTIYLSIEIQASRIHVVSVKSYEQFKYEDNLTW